MRDWLGSYIDGGIIVVVSDLELLMFFSNSRMQSVTSNFLTSKNKTMLIHLSNKDVYQMSTHEYNTLIFLNTMS